jgi:hypothetical protein
MEERRNIMMKPWLIASISVFILTTSSLAQWQQSSQVDKQTGPIYPINPSYNYYSSSANQSSFQFNWYSGNWDYVPIPYNTDPISRSQTPYVYNPINPNPPQAAGSPGQGSVPVAPSLPTATTNNPPPPNPPTASPQLQLGANQVKFTGQMVTMKTISLTGINEPQILLRLVSDNGARGTIDVGNNLDPTDIHNLTNASITATGKLGFIDGHMILFADTLSFGRDLITINRQPTTQPQ